MAHPEAFGLGAMPVLEIVLWLFVLVLAAGFLAVCVAALPLLLVGGTLVLVIWLFTNGHGAIGVLVVLGLAGAWKLLQAHLDGPAGS